MSAAEIIPYQERRALAGLAPKLPAQSDAYLNVFLRQPLPGFSFLPLHMEAMVDLRNLLAQGYVPVMGQDGRTVYLVQSARAVRGGVAFIF